MENNKTTMEVSCSKSQKSALINFLDPALQPSISCSALSAEDNPVENLISSDINASNRGFVVYLSKPPISLNINLMCSIELASIKIWPEIGSLKSTGFEIFIIKKDSNEKIASCDELNENSVVFCRLNDSSEIHASHIKKCFFFRNLRQNTIVDKLMIRIWKTKNSCVPVIKKIEIWGNVTQNRQLNEKVLKLWNARNTHHNVEMQSTESTEMKLQSNSTNDIEIPDELLDTITHQIMAIPMVLPSGKMVDQSTLEKFYKVEATWGREPSDPFTGLTFTDTRKPVFNPAVKSSIDKFLNKYPNSMEFNTVPRTVGSFGTVFGKGKRIATTSSLLNSGGSTKRLKYFGPSGVDINDSTKYLFRPTLKEVNEIVCYKCQSVEELYRIKTCDKHYICRMCLRNIDFHNCKAKCSCSRQFSQSDVEKYHCSNSSFNYYLS